MTEDANAALTASEQMFNDATSQAQGMFNNVFNQALDTATEFATAAVGGRRVQQDIASDINTLSTDAQNALTDVENTFNGITQATQGALNNLVTQTEQAFGLGGERLQQDAAGTNGMENSAGDLIEAGAESIENSAEHFRNVAGDMAIEALHNTQSA